MKLTLIDDELDESGRYVTLRSFDNLDGTWSTSVEVWQYEYWVLAFHRRNLGGEYKSLSERIRLTPDIERAMRGFTAEQIIDTWTTRLWPPSSNPWRSNVKWTNEQDELLRALYTHSTALKLKRTFRGWTYHQIQRRASLLGLKRPQRDGLGRIVKPRVI